MPSVIPTPECCNRSSDAYRPYVNLRTALACLLAAVLICLESSSVGQTFPPVSGSDAATNSLSPIPPGGTLSIQYDFFQIPDTMNIYYEGVNVFSSGLIAGAGQFVVPYGAGASTDITIVMNEGGAITGGSPPSNWSYEVSVIPEPSSLSLILIGAGSLVIRRANGLSAAK